MSPAEVTEKLGLHRMRDRSWYVHPRYDSKNYCAIRPPKPVDLVVLRPGKAYSKGCNGSRRT